MSVRPVSVRLASAPGPAPPRWPTLDPRRANDSADEMIRHLVNDVNKLKMELYNASDQIKLLNELRARDHSAREAAFTGRFVAMEGAFRDKKESIYDVRVGLLDDKHVMPGRLADDAYVGHAKWLVTVRFMKAVLIGARVNYDGKLVAGEFEQFSGESEYEIKCAARLYMLKHTGWQPMFPTDKKPDSVAPYSLF